MRRAPNPTGSRDSATRQALIVLIRRDPTLSASELAQRVGVTRQRVHALLTDLGYTRYAEWRRG